MVRLNTLPALVCAIALLAGCAPSPVRVASAATEGQVSADAYGNTHFTLGGRHFVLKPIDGKPIGNLAVQVAGRFYSTNNGSFGLNDTAIKDLQTNARGFFRVFAPGYVPRQVWIGQQADDVALTPILAVKVAMGMPPTGGTVADPATGISIDLPTGFLTAPATNVALSTYTPPPREDQPQAVARRSDFLNSLAKLSTTRSVQAATDCSAADDPLPCPPATAGLGLMLTVDGPIKSGVVTNRLDLKGLEHGNADQRAAASRIRATFANIDHKGNGSAYRDLLANQYGLRLDGDVLTFSALVGDQASTDGFARVEVDGLDLLGVNMELTVVSAAGTSLPPAASVPALAPTTTSVLDRTGVAGIGKSVLAGLIGNDGGGLISNDGGSLIGNDGGSLIGNDGGSLISNDGGSLTGAVTVPTGFMDAATLPPPPEAKFALLSGSKAPIPTAYPDAPALTALVSAFNVAGVPVWLPVNPLTGNYLIANVGPSQSCMFLYSKPSATSAYRMAAIIRAPHYFPKADLSARASISAASTAVSLWVLYQMRVGNATINDIDPAGYSADVNDIRDRLSTSEAQAILGQDYRVGAKVAQTNMGGAAGFRSLTRGAYTPVVVP
ncbi:MAG: hypothetical protein JWM80_2770 [Cyanobacteria bacterium RYN_339]|nr:hypothetical protein [Cyanobacteria bacterium RYN_339]